MMSLLPATCDNQPGGSDAPAPPATLRVRGSAVQHTRNAGVLLEARLEEPGRTDPGGYLLAQQETQQAGF